jgi:hypothetical protein
MILSPSVDGKDIPELLLAFSLVKHLVVKSARAGHGTNMFAVNHGSNALSFALGTSAFS